MLKEECKTCEDRDKCSDLMSALTHAYDEMEIICGSFNELMSIASANTSTLGLLIASKLMAARLAITIEWLTVSVPEELVLKLDKYINAVAAREKAGVEEVIQL